MRALVGASALVASACAQPKDAASQAVAEICDARIALLGESIHHGNATELRFRADLLRRALDACANAPTLVAVEASLYEFARLNRRLEAGGSVSPEDVAVALGWKWGRYKEGKALAAQLSELMNDRALRVVGLGDQIGAFGQDYGNFALVGELSDALAEPRRTACRDALQRRVFFDYSDDHPRDAAARDTVQRCARLLHEAAPPGRGVEMASLQRFLARDETEITPVPPRSASMFENLAAQIVEPGERVVVWASQAHVARDPSKPTLGSLVARHAPGDTFHLGFAALSGAERFMDGTLRSLPDPQDQTARALANRAGEADAVYLDAAELRSLGLSPDVDGLVVFRRAEPATPRS